MTKERLSDALVWLSLAIVFGSFIPEIISGSPVAQESKHLWAFAYGFCVVLNRVITGRFRIVPWVK
jgi:hypothetical protein